MIYNFVSVIFVCTAEGGNWPFIMTDGANELVNIFGCEIKIPVLMIGPDDAALLEKMLMEAQSHSRKCLPAAIQFGSFERDCAVCQESYVHKDIVMKLPCRHLYHAECLSSWLIKNNTCPLCRHKLPSAAAVDGDHALPATHNDQTRPSSQPYFT